MARYCECSTSTINHYTANTDKGLINNINSDRISIVTSNKGQLPSFCYFGIYDGHGGATCADLLREKLHVHIMNKDFFPKSPVAAIYRGYEKMEKEFIEFSTSKKNLMDTSGSSALSALILDDMCYVANLGDSRAILSSKFG